MIVYYRMCNIPSTNPSPVFQHDKFRLNKLCLRSFVKAYKEIKPKIVFICDYCPPQYVDMIEREVPFQKEIVMTEMGINETCLYQYELYDQATDECVLFQECDYFHIKPLTELQIKELQVVTPYDHPDKYPDEVSHIQIIDSHHFKHTKSTTSTFACTREYFETNRETLDSYGYIDHERWVTLGGLASPIPTFATHMVTNYLSPGIIWKNHFTQL